MPIIFVDEEILDYRLECVLCPIKGNQFYLYNDIDGLIYKKAGQDALDREFMRVNPLQMTVPALSGGVKLSKYMIHIIGADLIYAKDFKKDIYNSYDRTLRMIKDNQFNSVVFPPIPFSYKRLGNMHSYRTAITLLNYFLRLYDINSTNIYILIKKQTMIDHMENYVSTYVSTSSPSKRHKPIVYPLRNNQELEEYLQGASLDTFKEYYGNSNYNVNINNTKIPKLCKMIKEKFKDDDLSFCIKSNMNKKSYIKLFETDYIPTQDELYGICMALKLELLDAYEVLKMCGKSISYDDARDCEFISAVATHKYDVLELNQKLFVKGLTQIGSNIHPSKFAVATTAKV